jgi:hypothetical protein
MTLFSNAQNSNKYKILINRMIALQKTVQNNQLSREALQSIATLSTTELEQKFVVKNNKIEINDPNIEQLFTIINNPENADITDDAQVVDALKSFDNEQEHYLPLLPLSTDNSQTVASSLNDFAMFYFHFTKYMSIESKQGALGNKYTLKFDALAAKTDWIEWELNRPERLSFDPSKAGHPGIFEKFLAGRLKGEEWLSDLDIQRALTILGLRQKTHVVPFKADDIGLAIHFEREKHQQDNPKNAYVIPLIVNLGEDGHSRIDSRGSHWTRILVHVDPSHFPTTIRIDYKDELFLHEGAKKQIETTLRDALKYHVQLGGYTTGEALKIYTAFPECEHPIITITGSGEQKDVFTCGYRAIQGLVKEMSSSNPNENNEEWQKVLNCNDTLSLRNWIYRVLISEQNINQETKSILEKKSNLNEVLIKDIAKTVINPQLVEGQLFAFSYPNMVSKQQEPKGYFNHNELQRLATLNHTINDLRQETMIKSIAEPTDNSLSLNLHEILAQIPTTYDRSLVLHVIFEKIQQFSNLKYLELEGISDIDQQFLSTIVESLPIDLQINSKDTHLQPYLNSLNARNSLLESKIITPKQGTDAWHALFEDMLYTPPKIPTSTSFEWMSDNTPLFPRKEGIKYLGALGFTKMLQYISDNVAQFSERAFPFQEFKMINESFLQYFLEHITYIDTTVDLKAELFRSLSNLEMVVALRKHLESENPSVPFKRFNFYIPNLESINQEELVQEFILMLKNANSSGIEKLEITTESLALLSEETVRSLLEQITKNKYPMIISFSAKDKANSTLLSKLEELENTGLANRRQKLSNAVESTQLNQENKTTIGRIGESIFRKGNLGSLNVDIQIQEQQQQQIQQQIQTAINDEELPLEDELKEEQLFRYSSDEKPLTRNTFFKMLDYISFRFPDNIYPASDLHDKNCWDLFTGENSGLFKYGIKKITPSAAKILIDHLEDVQYGLHPDNLPHGFFLQQDDNGEVVLAYTKNPPINPNESPLTVRFNKPILPNNWSGNFLQFMRDDEARSLYNTVIKSMKDPLPSYEKCISEFFFLRTNESNITLTDEQRSLIFNHLIKGMDPKNADMIQQKIKALFGKQLSSQNINALSEVLYEQGPAALSTLLDSLTQIKAVNGEKFFASFKVCFIDSSQNLNELTSEASITAMQKLLTMSPAQKTWWLSLTEQHTSNLNLPLGIEKKAGQRWANLAELSEGFLYFCAQLEELIPGLNLTEYCPFSGVADMRVGLDRLLTLLSNAHNIKEQFYEGLKGLSLEASGPFYASRFEGYKLVTPAMLLSLSASYKEKPEDNKKIFSSDEFCFRTNKENTYNNLYKTADGPHCFEQQKSLLLRYIATFNHRAPVNQYIEAYSKITSMDFLEPMYKDTFKYRLIIFLATFGTGKRGKYFSQNDIDSLIKWIEDNKKQQGSVDRVLSAWRSMQKQPIQPTFAEIVAISDLAIKADTPQDFIEKVNRLVSIYNTAPNASDVPANSYGQDYLDCLMLLTKNKNRINAQIVQDVIYELEGLNGNFKNVKDAVAEFQDMSPQFRVATAKILAVCNAVGIDNKDKALVAARKLYSAVEECLKKHGEQTTLDLLELLGHIDLEASFDKQTLTDFLPSLEQLTTLIENISTRSEIDYSDLKQYVQNTLPKGCVIQTNKISSTSMEPSGNLLTIITQHIRTIEDQLRGNESLVNAVLGEGFFESLATPEGPKTLLDCLQFIADIDDFRINVVKPQIRATMEEVYRTVMRDGLNKIGVKDNSAKDRIATLFDKGIHHQVKKEADFKGFAALYASELDSLSQLLGNLKHINQTWPADLNKVIDKFENCKHLKSYPISLLAKITQELIENSSESTPFPSELLGQFLALEIKPDIHNILILIFETLSAQEKTKISNEQKQLLYELALSYCRHDLPNASIHIENLLKLQKKDNELFSSRLKLHFATTGDFAAINSSFEKINELKEPVLKTMIFDFFIQNKNNGFNFPEIVTAIQEPDKRAIILHIALKAAQINLQGNNNKLQQNEIIELINKLNTLDISTLKQLDVFYHMPKYPDLETLNGLLETKTLDIDALQKTYDRDPWPEDKKRNFDTSKLHEYLNKLQDMLYERPLLLSQRQELQKWFLYVNAIGNNKPIPTQPSNPDSACKATKDMNHNEIQDLLQYYRLQIANPACSDKARVKLQLEMIALLREVMYRSTGNFPRPTQILYSLLTMQGKESLMGQIPTGQGKSLTFALAAIMGKHPVIATNKLSLAEQGLDENKRFFDYLDIPTVLISASSGIDDFKEGAIHYTSVTDFALYFSKMEIAGKEFPEDWTLYLDEADFSNLDDNTRSRYATALDPISDPHKSPYTWIYETLVRFVDTQSTPLSDKELIEQAKTHIERAATNKEKRAQLDKLNEQKETYNKRLETWLVAAGTTSQLIKYDDNGFRERFKSQEHTPKFRVVQLDHDKYGTISKACILTTAGPSIEAEYSDAIQQFLHVRLREKYSEEIKNGEMADFLVEPEKSYVSTLNPKILINIFKKCNGLSATLGSISEIKELFAKYGFRFVDIPQFEESKRDDLDPILTNPKFLDNPEKESEEHIQLIVKDVIRQLKQSIQETSEPNPILIHCATKEQGEKIHKALEQALANNKKLASQIQRYYGSEKATPKERNAEEQRFKDNGAINGMITISNVFGRGIDIKPKHKKCGLHTIDTFINTPVEDLERAKKQKIGRSGRAGQAGTTRLIVCRSEFAKGYTKEQMKKIPSTVKELDKAISYLNQYLNENRVQERELRESFDDVKETVHKKFINYLKFVNQFDSNTGKKEVRDHLLTQWSFLLGSIDTYWDNLLHDIHLDKEERLQKLVEFACVEWNELSKSDGIFNKHLTKWLEHQKSSDYTALPNSNDLQLDQEIVIKNIVARNKTPESYYVKNKQTDGLIEACSLLEDAVYSDFMSTDTSNTPKTLKIELEKAKETAIQKYIQQQLDYLNTGAHKKKIGRHHLENTCTNEEKVLEIMKELLDLKYQIYRSGNSLACSELSVRCRNFEKQILWSGEETLIKALAQAHEAHFNTITHYRGNAQEERSKAIYLRVLMAQGNQLFADHNYSSIWCDWKKANLATWLGNEADSSGIKKQAQDWLTSYKDKSWTRGWVSDDRKDVVQKLLADLDKNNTPQEILTSISTARQQLLENDADRSRSMKSSLEGRLYRYLDELENKVHAAMTPEELDTNIKEIFNKAQNILQHASHIMINNEPLQSTFKVLDSEHFDLQEKYQTLSVFFINISHMNKPQEVTKSDWDVLQSYCQETKLLLPYHFSQCNQYKSLNEQRSVQVYQATSEAASRHFQSLNSISHHKLTAKEINTIKYQERDVELELNPNLSSQIKNTPLFLRIHQDDIYPVLLSELEEAIVEKSPDDTLVQFNKISIKQDKHTDKQIELSIDMTINGIPCSTTYHLNVSTGEMYCDDSGLKKLNLINKEAVLGDLPHSNIAELRQKLDENKEEGKLLTNLINDTLTEVTEAKPTSYNSTPVTQRFRDEMQKFTKSGEENHPSLAL